MICCDFLSLEKGPYSLIFCQPPFRLGSWGDSLRQDIRPRHTLPGSLNEECWAVEKVFHQISWPNRSGRYEDMGFFIGFFIFIIRAYPEKKHPETILETSGRNRNSIWFYPSYQLRFSHWETTSHGGDVSWWFATFLADTKWYKLWLPMTSWGLKLSKNSTFQDREAVFPCPFGHWNHIGDDEIHWNSRWGAQCCFHT